MTVAAGSGGALKVIWILWFVLLLYLIWKIVNWWDTCFVITRNRLMLVTGVFDKTSG
jgi:uncharacterized membrane protein YdbT with pleckstrin-like domain